ncbi:M48 family metallopeptidase [Thermosynechococcus sp. HN-54]|uniref:M48 family metallopeptidase n=1 Tax=Thermosynechococcus sp. HN-54 TaxID=2933959 RepID=UPI00202CC50B|nr:M48 family metallopeptidase [Thermosynechococcus sp. HN-54]URR34453.1 M48 family metallopeptidase [Thermosynechococcus sp. HN-54]
MWILRETAAVKKQRWFLLFASLVCGVAIALHPVAVQAQNLWQRLLLQGIQVIQLSNISPRQEVALGQQIHEQMLRQGMRLVRNPAAQNYVNSIGERLVSVGERRGLPYHFHIIQDRQVNAYATMGGFVYVTTGLMLKAENEAELASVIAHEIGHIDQRHVIRQLQQMAIAQGLMTAAGLDRDRGLQMAMELAFRRPRSREQELEADRYGLGLLARSNYDPRAMVTFLQKLQRGGGAPPTILSTHPAPRDRQLIAENLIRSGFSNECVVAPQPFCGTDTLAYQQRLRSF